MAVRADRHTHENRPQQIREANTRLAREAERLRFAARVPMLCECSDDGCDQLFLMSLWDFRSAHDAFVTAPGHRIESARPVRQGPEFWLHRRD
jgi:hypothetical protein